jgi:hypothetical protein|nr:MAG TPA: hypothetical protein [Bacteriophage sp.]
MTLEQLICYKRKSSKIVVTKMIPSTEEQELIFSGYETDICDEVTPEFMEFFEEYKNHLVINFGTVIDRNGIPYTDVLVYA